MSKQWKWCLLDTDKKQLCTGWIQLNNKWYFMYENGIMASAEWVRYKNKWYYLNKDGDMAVNTVIGNWKIGTDGVATEQVNTNSQLFEFIKKFEGCYTKAYYCPSGVLTIGIGCTNTKWTAKGTITIEQCKEAFNEDIKTFENGVDSLGLSLKSYERDALISFAFNVGLGSLKSSTLIRIIKEGNRNTTDITNAFGMWVKGSGGKTLPGLVTRRQAEAKLFLTGSYN